MLLNLDINLNVPDAIYRLWDYYLNKQKLKVISVISYQLSSTQTINRGALIAEKICFPRIIDGLYPVSFLVKDIKYPHEK